MTWRASSLAAMALVGSACATTGLHEAVKAGDLAEVNRRLAAGESVHTRAGPEGSTPLGWAVSQGNREIAAALIAHGADVNAPCTSSGDRPLHDAAHWRRKDMVEFLLARGANPSVTMGKDRATPLHSAIEPFVPLGPRPVYVHVGALCPPKCEHVVVSASDLDTLMGTAALLLDGGADPNAAMTEGLTPLHLAAAAGHRPLVELLVDRGAALDARGREGVTPLYAATIAGRVEVAELLVARGAQVDARTESGYTPLSYAARSGNAELASLLIARGADVNARDVAGRTPLAWALSMRAVASPAGDPALRVVGVGAEERAQLREQLKATPGMWGPIAMQLVERGADVRLHAANEPPCLYLAALVGDGALVEALLDHGAAIDDVTADETALHAAIAERHLSVAALLVRRGANVRIVNMNRRTPLHFVAALTDDASLAEAVVASGADVNARDRDGRTPLAYAVKAGHGHVAAVLRSHGGK